MQYFCHNALLSARWETRWGFHTLGVAGVIIILCWVQNPDELRDSKMRNLCWQGLGTGSSSAFTVCSRMLLLGSAGDFVIRTSELPAEGGVWCWMAPEESGIKHC